MNHFHLLDQYCHDCANRKYSNENWMVLLQNTWFWTKFSERIACTSCKPQLKIPYLFSRNCANTVSSPILKSLGRSSTVNNVCLRKLLYNASPFIKIISRSNWSHRLTSFKVEYEIANNAIHAHWMPAVSPNVAFLWSNDPCTTLQSPDSRAIFKLFFAFFL